eukprot:scaffold3717_cov124-Isochrysis_galbana.AAC.20
MSALGTDRALKRRLDLFGMPASERGTPTPATVPDVRLPMQDRHGVAQAPARLVRLIRPPLPHRRRRHHLSMTERMAKRLDVAQMGHIGQNIRILTQDEH